MPQRRGAGHGVGRQCVGTQLAAIRAAADTWRSEPGLPCPRPDGRVRDIIEVLLGTAMRPGEVLARRPRDVVDDLTGMLVTDTVVYPRRRAGLALPLRAS